MASDRLSPEERGDERDSSEQRAGSNAQPVKVGLLLLQSAHGFPIDDVGRSVHYSDNGAR